MLGNSRFFRESGSDARSISESAVLIPHSVEDAIADIATVFHWPPSVFDEMELDELMNWREKARQRVQTDE
ncbi:GpE family phage tail protein [Testudinibacter aquarius]|uniref:GpE family phage tail protein n=1 Tax=Testudinibacter aquarius TaxID=1524974 RepID=UPI0034CEED71